MAVHDIIQRLFKSYFGKHFSKEGRTIFGRWLISETYQKEKEEQLQNLWSVSKGEITDKTKADWLLLHTQIHRVSLRKSYVEWMKYAAVIILFFLSIGGTFYTTTQHALRQPTEMAEVFVPNGETKEIILPDQTKVWLNAGSTLIYTKDFERMTSRSIYLSGEASFSVTKNKEKPFIVKTSKVNVEALGTVFTVTSYSDELFTTATLEEGKIKVDVNNDKSKSHILYPSEQLIYSHTDGNIRLKKVSLEQFEKRRNGYLIFQNAPLREILIALERKYGVTFQYNSSRYNNDLYNLKFLPSETIENVMIILQQLIDFNYRIVDKNIIIK